MVLFPATQYQIKRPLPAMAGMGIAHAGDGVRMPAKSQPVANFRPDRTPCPLPMRDRRKRARIACHHQQHPDIPCNCRGKGLVKPFIRAFQRMPVKIDGHFGNERARGDTALPIVVQNGRRASASFGGRSGRGARRLSACRLRARRRVPCRAGQWRGLDRHRLASPVKRQDALRHFRPDLPFFRAEWSTSHVPPPAVHRCRSGGAARRCHARTCRPRCSAPVRPRPRTYRRDWRP